MAESAELKIWVDADACPTVVKQILFRAAERTRTVTTLIANHSLQVPASPYLRFVQVAQGFDVADNEIVSRAQPGDLIITADIPLAADAVAQGCQALSPRGELYTPENIRSRLNMRDFMATLRDSGLETGGAAPLSQSDRQLFASRLDTILAKAGR